MEIVLNNVRCEARRYFRNKTTQNEKSRDLCRGISYLKMITNRDKSLGTEQMPTNESSRR
jgi:hypothetical protein